MSFSKLNHISGFKVLGASGPFEHEGSASVLFKHSDLGYTLLECGWNVYATLRKTNRVRLPERIIITSLQDHSVGSLATLIRDRYSKHGRKTKIHLPVRLLPLLEQHLMDRQIENSSYELVQDNRIDFTSTSDLWYPNVNTYSATVLDKEWSFLWSGYCSLPIISVMERDKPNLFNEFSGKKYPLIFQDTTIKTHNINNHCHYSLLERHLDNYQHYSFGHTYHQASKVRKLSHEKMSCLCLWNN